jgi:hypothetical protein
VLVVDADVVDVVPAVDVVVLVVVLSWKHDSVITFGHVPSSHE